MRTAFAIQACGFKMIHGTGRHLQEPEFLETQHSGSGFIQSNKTLNGSQCHTLNSALSDTPSEGLKEEAGQTEEIWRTRHLSSMWREASISRT